MAVFEDSRYAGEELTIDTKGIKHLSPRRLFFKRDSSDYILQFKEGDRLDLIAKRFYGDSQLAWIILDVNPKYYKESEIKIGDYLNIPKAERVGR